MPTLNLNNAHVYALAKKLSEATGKSMTSVIETALERQLADLERPAAGTATRLMAIGARSAPLLRDLPSDPAADLYDPETGAPR